MYRVMGNGYIAAPDVWEQCFCTALPCPEEDYNTVVETSANKSTYGEVQAEIEETLQ